MRKIDNYIAVSCYKYATESFKAYIVLSFSHGNKNIPEYTEIKLTADEKSRCGYAYATKGRRAAVDEVKRIIRKAEKQSANKITFGATLKNHKRDFVYFQYEEAKADNISEKLMIYKRVKELFALKNWTHTYFEKATLNGNFEIEDKKKVVEELNRSLIVVHIADRPHIYGY